MDAAARTASRFKVHRAKESAHSEKKGGRMRVWWTVDAAQQGGGAEGRADQAAGRGGASARAAGFTGGPGSGGPGLGGLACVPVLPSGVVGARGARGFQLATPAPLLLGVVTPVNQQSKYFFLIPRHVAPGRSGARRSPVTRRRPEAPRGAKLPRSHDRQGPPGDRPPWDPHHPPRSSDPLIATDPHDFTGRRHIHQWIPRTPTFEVESAPRTNHHHAMPPAGRGGG